MKELFFNITEKNQKKILQSLEANTHYFKKNVSIFSNNKQDNFIGIVLEGYLQIIKIDYNGNRTIIEELERDSIFGSTISDLSNKEYDLITKEDSKIIIIDFKTIINQNEINSYYSQFLKNFLNILANKIERNNERIEILTNKTTRDKLLAYFNILSSKTKSKIIYLPFNYTDLAAYLSVDRSAMMREIKILKEDGVIETSNKKIKLKY